MIKAMSSQILIIGVDPSLVYLISRYCQIKGYNVNTASVLPTTVELCSLNPATILFTSLEFLERAQPSLTGLENCDIPILVCSSVGDEARACELGADHCLNFPVTYEGFSEAMGGKDGRP